MFISIDVQTTVFGTLAVIGDQDVRIPVPPGGELSLEPTSDGHARAVLHDAKGRPTSERVLVGVPSAPAAPGPAQD